MFKTQAEIYQALLDGKKLRHCGWVGNTFLHLVDGNPTMESGQAATLGFFAPLNWSIYEEPKPKRKFYRRKWVILGGNLVIGGDYWPSKTEADNFHRGSEASSEWEEIEIEEGVAL